MKIDDLNYFLKPYSIELTERQLHQFSSYKSILLEWNKKINLISRNDEDKIETHHFFDSLLASKSINEQNFIKGIDVGTGAGFPGLPISIVLAKTKITLVDSRQKRIFFLDTVIRKIKSQNVSTVCERIEKLSTPGKFIKAFDFVTVRAFADLSTVVEICLPFLRKNGILYAYKGTNVSDEIKASQDSLCQLNGKIIDCISYSLPLTKQQRKLILVKQL